MTDLGKRAAVGNSWGLAGTLKGDCIGHAVDQYLVWPYRCNVPPVKRVLKQVSSTKYVPRSLSPPRQYDYVIKGLDPLTSLTCSSKPLPVGLVARLVLYAR